MKTRKHDFVLEPSIKLKSALVRHALKWIANNEYKLPPPIGPEIREIHVPAMLIPGSMAVDVLVFDAWTQKLIAIEFDYYNTREVVVKRITL